MFYLRIAIDGTAGVDSFVVGPASLALDSLVEVVEVATELNPLVVGPTVDPMDENVAVCVLWAAASSA